MREAFSEASRRTRRVDENVLDWRPISSVLPMNLIRHAIYTLRRYVEQIVDGIADVATRLRERFRRPWQPSFTSVKWLSSRTIRQEYFTDQFENNPTLFDEEFASTVDKKREEAEKQFWKVALIQITITGLMLLALVKATVTFSILGISASDAYKLRDFLLFCQAAVVSWSIVLQQYHHKLEDVLAAWVKHNTQPDEGRLPMLLRYFGPIETFNINVLPYKRNQLHNLATKSIFRIHGMLRFLSAMGFVSFTMLTPLVVAISVYRDPPNGWFSFAAVIYWTVVALFAIASAAINVFGVPYTDYSYVMKLDALQKSDAGSHKRVLAEIKRTGRLVDFEIS